MEVTHTHNTYTERSRMHQNIQNSKTGKTGNKSMCPTQYSLEDTATDDHCPSGVWWAWKHSEFKDRQHWVEINVSHTVLTRRYSHRWSFCPSGVRWACEPGCDPRESTHRCCPGHASLKTSSINNGGETMASCTEYQYLGVSGGEEGAGKCGASN